MARLPTLSDAELALYVIATRNGATGFNINTPPGSPADGDAYVLGSSPTGAWSGHAKAIAVYSASAWGFIPAGAIGTSHKNLAINDADVSTATEYRWTGAAWRTSAASTGTNTGDETAAGILAKLLTVDGTGSGLDADLLDGQSAAAFAAASHTHSVSDITGLGTASLLASDADGTLSANSDSRLATQKAVKTYVDQIIAAQDAMVFKGVIDCSASPNYPAADRGHTYRVSAAGKIGGASGTTVEVGDLLLCLTDSTASGTQAGVGANWSIAQVNIDGAVVGPSSSTSGNLPTFSGTSGKVIADSGYALSAFGGSLVSAANAAAGRTALALVIGVDVQAYNASLAAIAGLTVTNDSIIQAKAGAWAARTIAQLKTDLALMEGPGTSTDNAIARFDSTTGKIVQNSAVLINDDGSFDLAVASSVAAPATDHLALYVGKKSGRPMPTYRGPSGVETALQASLARNRIAAWMPAGNATTVSVVGSSALSATGVATAASVATTNVYTQQRIVEYLETTPSTTAVAGFRNNVLQFFRGASAGQGGFHFVIRFAPATGVSNGSHRAFVGLRGSASAPTDVDPSSLINIIGLGYDATDTNMQIMTNDNTGTATKTNLGASFPKPSVDRTSVYEFEFYCAPNGSTIYYSVTNLTTGATTSGSTNSDLPASTNLLCPNCYMSAGGVSSVVGIALAVLYIETDY